MVGRGRARRNLIVKATGPVVIPDYPLVVSAMGYNVWDWDASRSSTLFQDSAMSNPVSVNGDPVGAWVDGVQSAPVVQNTTANKPTYTTNALSGLPTLSFDGSDFLSTASDIGISTFAIWVVMRTTSSSASVFRHGNANAILGTSATGSIIVSRTLAASKNGEALNDGSYKTIRFEHDGTYDGLQYYKNNNLINSTPNTVNDVGTGTSTSKLTIGAKWDGAFAMVGNIAEFCIVSPYPTDEVIFNMELYINNTWGAY